MVFFLYIFPFKRSYQCESRQVFNIRQQSDFKSFSCIESPFSIITQPLCYYYSASYTWTWYMKCDRCMVSRLSLFQFDLEIPPNGHCDSAKRAFRCDDGRCLPRDQVCDVSKDCPGGEDEDQDCGEKNNLLFLNFKTLSSWNPNACSKYSYLCILNRYKPFMYIQYRIIYRNAVHVVHILMRFTTNFQTDQVLEGSRCDFERGWCGWTNTVSVSFISNHVYAIF